MLPTTILLITLAGGSAEPVAALKALRSEHPDLFAAPRLPDPPADLEGMPLRIPDKARCVDLAGAELAPGAYMPKPWADALHLRLEQAGMLPATMQAQLDLVADLALVAVDAQGKAVRADAAVEATRASVQGGPGFWDYLPPVAVALSVGLVAGFLGAVALSK